MLFDLPDLPQREIFSFLSIPERLRTRLVCKDWKFMIETLHLPQRLCIYSTGCPKGDEWLDCNGKRVSDDELLQLKFNFKLTFVPTWGLRTKFFPNLLCLYLYEIPDKKLELFLKQTNQLAQMKVLMIYGEQISVAKRLSSSSLESLSMKYLDDVGRLELDTPNLSSLVLWFWSIWPNKELYFHFPTTIKRLECTEFNMQMNQLRSLEILVCLQIVWKDFKLEYFKSLKRLEIWPCNRKHLELVQQIQEEQNASKRTMQLIVCGFEELLVICEREHENNHLNLSEDYLEQIENNLSKFVGYAPWAVSLDIGVLHRYADRIPVQLIAEHFPNINLITADDQSFALESPIAPSRLIELLRRSRPRELRIKMRIKMKLTREFYVQLASLDFIKSLTLYTRLPSENEFEIVVEDEHRELFEFDHFDCLTDLKNLESIHLINCAKISADFMKKMVRLPFFSSFEFRIFEEFSIEISFSQYGDYIETHGPIYFAYKLDYYRYSRVEKRIKEVEELIAEIWQMEEIELIQPYLV